MRDNQQPKYLNTSDSDLYHKRNQLFGIDLARTAAAREGRMVLVEGYTDVLALHQAGLANTVAIMGTSLTEEQVRELERVARVLVLCLDADRAGQEAMLRAERLAAARGLELHVVSLPEGRDPADLIEREGAEALRSLVSRSERFVKFQVERILDAAGTSAEGRERAVREVAPVLAGLRDTDGVLRDDLRRHAAERLGVSEGRLASMMMSGAGAGAGSGAGVGARAGVGAGSGATGEGERTSVTRLDHDVRQEQIFLAMCIAVPDAGDRILAEIDPDELLTSGPLRRAARHLAGRARSPLADLPRDDEELARVVAALVARAGRAGSVSAAHLEHARLTLEKSRIERAIRRARAQRATGIAELARAKEEVLAGIREVVARLERAV
jgi:DNA primase